MAGGAAGAEVRSQRRGENAARRAVQRARAARAGASGAVQAAARAEARHRGAAGDPLDRGASDPPVSRLRGAPARRGPECGRALLFFAFDAL